MDRPKNDRVEVEAAQPSALASEAAGALTAEAANLKTGMGGKSSSSLPDLMISLEPQGNRSQDPRYWELYDNQNEPKRGGRNEGTQILDIFMQELQGRRTRGA